MIVRSVETWHDGSQKQKNEIKKIKHLLTEQNLLDQSLITYDETQS